MGSRHGVAWAPRAAVPRVYNKAMAGSKGYPLPMVINGDSMVINGGLMVINGGLMVINGDSMVINGGLMVINGDSMVIIGDLPSGKLT